MQIIKGIETIHEALWLKKNQILIISDLHLGYEESLHHKGILIPKQQINLIIANLKVIFDNIKPKIIIINGDLKHEFGRVLNQEWSDIFKLIDFLSDNCQELILIKGNHDKTIGPIINKNKIKMLNYYKTKNILILHGDKLVETDAKTIIIGHEHPAVILKEKSKIEKYKCFLKGKWDNKNLIVLPSFNPLLEGTNILGEKLLSPFLKNISNFDVFIISKNETFAFGKCSELIKH